MANTEHLSNMLDNLIADKSDQAQVDFHTFMQQKMSEIINPEVDDATDTDAGVEETPGAVDDTPAAE